MEKKFGHGDAIRFPMQYSRGFEMEKKYKKWLEDWQKLPYFSPYENLSHSSLKSDELDRWAVAVLHEFLQIMIPKKTEKENVMWFGECLGLRGRLKKAMFEHPGIFYLSSKNDTYTLVLKEGYKRGVLVENHPWMSMRSKYIQLMNSSKEENKTVVISGGNAGKKNVESSEVKGESESEEEKNEGEGSRLSEDEEEGEDAGSGRRRRRTGTGSEVKRRGGSRERGGLATEKRERRFERRPRVDKRNGSLVAERSPT